MVINRQQLLDKLVSKMEASAKNLPLAGTPQHIVPAEGNPDAEIFFIGEAAGYHELEQRRPFVGVAGQLLTKTLLANGIKRGDVWISNIVKARPPENRDPLPEEIEAYRPYLDEELNIIQPKLVVTLGRFSMGKFLGPDVRISQIHGQARWINFNPLNNLLPSLQSLRFVLLPMYHPAAALRAGAVLNSFEEDFKKIPEILKRLSGEAESLSAGEQKHDKMEETKADSEKQEETQQLSLI